MWYNNSWLYRIKFTIPSSQVASNLTDFPVFLDLQALPPAFHENVKSDGADIRITSSDGTTELAREVVYYDTSTNRGEVHFKTNLSSSSNNVFYIYYGNSSATNHADGATYGAYNVWTTSSAVYHLNETNNTTSNGYKNSKANSNHGTGTSMGLAKVESKVGNQQQFDGVDDRIQIGSVFSIGTTNSTMSGWVTLDADTGKGMFMKLGTNSNGYGVGWGDSSTDNVGNKLIVIYDAVRWIVTSATLATGTYFVAVVINGSGVPSVYLNGALVNSYSGTNMNTPGTTSQIGAAVSGSRYFTGKVDEVRYVNSARTANWLLTEFRNQNNPYAFYAVEGQEWLYPPEEEESVPKNLLVGELDIPEYTVELWSSTGVYMADVSTILTTGLRIQIPLNDVEQIDFNLDLVQFEEKCARIGATPRNILDPYRTEVKIKRNGAYLLGAQVVQAQINLNNQGANTIEVRCTGYLNLFKDRYIKPGTAPALGIGNYSNRTYAQLAQRLILDTQSQTNGDFGVTIGPDLASPGQSQTRTRAADYDNQNVKDGILNLTKLENDNFDFRFTWDKRFEVFERLGYDKPSIELVYPQNVVSMTISRDASTLANKITGIASGIGDERLEYTSTDSTSALDYGIRERIELFNSVQNTATLNSNVEGLVPIYKDIYEIPLVEVTNGAIQPGDVIVGDAVLVKVEGSTFTESINDMYRIVNMNINVSKENEESITLKLSKWEGGVVS